LSAAPYARPKFVRGHKTITPALADLHAEGVPVIEWKDEGVAAFVVTGLPPAGFGVIFRAEEIHW
jgi:hypothetical protein